jgi:transcriptional regulator with XRE-family HTH domain
MTMTASWVDDFAVEIRELRAARGWSQAALARRAGVSQSLIRNIENPDEGYEPYDQTVRDIARAFGADGVALLRRVGRDSMADYLEANQADPLADLTDDEREVALRIIRDIVELGRRSHTERE